MVNRFLHRSKTNDSVWPDFSIASTMSSNLHIFNNGQSYQVIKTVMLSYPKNLTGLKNLTAPVTVNTLGYLTEYHEIIFTS